MIVGWLCIILDWHLCGLLSNIRPSLKGGLSFKCGAPCKLDLAKICKTSQKHTKDTRIIEGNERKTVVYRFFSWDQSQDMLTNLSYPILERRSTVLLLLLLLLLLLCHAQATPLDSETGWTRELWLKTNLLNWQN